MCNLESSKNTSPAQVGPRVLCYRGGGSVEPVSARREVLGAVAKGLLGLRVSLKRATFSMNGDHFVSCQKNMPLARDPQTGFMFT